MLLIERANSLTAEFSPPAIAARSRLRTTPEFTSTQETKPDEDKEKPTLVTYKINVPLTAVPGDVARSSLIEADGTPAQPTQLRVLAPAGGTEFQAMRLQFASRRVVRCLCRP